MRRIFVIVALLATIAGALGQAVHRPVTSSDARRLDPQLRDMVHWINHWEVRNDVPSDRDGAEGRHFLYVRGGVVRAYFYADDEWRYVEFSASALSPYLEAADFGDSLRNYDGTTTNIGTTIEVDTTVIPTLNALKDSLEKYITKLGDVGPGQYARHLVSGLPGTMLSDAGMGVFYDRNELAGYEYNGGSVTITDGAGWHDPADAPNLCDQSGEYLLFTGLTASDSVVITFEFDDLLPNYGGFAYWQPFAQVRDTTGYTYPDTVKVYLSHDGTTWGTPADDNWIAPFPDSSFYGLWMGKFKSPSGMVGDQWKYAKFVFRGFNIGTTYNYFMLQEIGIRHYNTPPAKAFATQRGLVDSLAKQEHNPGGLLGSVQYNNGGEFDGFGEWDGRVLTVPGGIDIPDSCIYRINGVNGLSYTPQNNLYLGPVNLDRNKLVNSILAGYNSGEGMLLSMSSVSGITACGSYALKNSMQNTTNAQLVDAYGYGAGLSFAQNATGTVEYVSMQGSYAGRGFAQNATGNVSQNGCMLLYSGDYAARNSAIVYRNLFLGPYAGSNLGYTTTGNVQLNSVFGALAGYQFCRLTPTAAVQRNTIFGAFAGGYANSTGSIGSDYTSLFGAYAGYQLTDGLRSTYIGAVAGRGSNGNNNTSVGYTSMRSYVGDYSVALGYQAGYNYSGDHKLYIGITPATYGHLITGDFADDSLSVNGIMRVRDAIHLNQSNTTTIDADASDIILTDPTIGTVTVDSLQRHYNVMDVWFGPAGVTSHASRQDTFHLKFNRGFKLDIVNSNEDTVIAVLDTTILVTHDSLANKLKEWKYVPVDISVGGSNAATETEVSNGWLAYSFADAATRYVRFNFTLPPEFDDATAAAMIVTWFTPTTSAVCRWSLDYQPRAIDEDADASAGFTLTQSETSSGTAEGLVQSTFTFNSSDVSSSDVFLQCKLSRQGASIFDTVNAAVYLLDVVFKYKTTE